MRRAGGSNSFTDGWIARAEAELAALMTQTDAAVSNRVVGVWLCAGASGEWNYRVSADCAWRTRI